jgi:hypothetical protein
VNRRRSFPNAAPPEGGRVELQLALPGRSIDLSSALSWTPLGPRQHPWWLVLGRCRRGGQTGRALGTLILRPAATFVVLLEFPDGAVEAFAGVSLAHGVAPAEAS